MTATTTAPTAQQETRRWWPVVRSVGAVGLAVAGLVAFLAWMGGAFREKIRPGEIPVSRHSAAGRATAVVEKRSVADVATVVGSVQPRRRTEVSAQLLARILDVKVRPGDVVKPEQELMLLDDRELRAQQAEALAAVTVAEADLLVRKTDLARAQNERDKGVIGAAEFARFEGAFKVAEAQVKRAKEAVGRLDVQLTYTKILATSRGVVSDRFADPGDIAAPGKPLMVIYDPAELELHADVPESLTPKVREGQQLTLHIEAADLKDVVGTVREVVPRAQQASRSVLVKVTLPPGSAKPLLPGMFGRVNIPVGTVERLFVPRAAVRQLGQLDLVEVVSADGFLSRRFVRVGPAMGDRVEILSGVAQGETVALPPR
ncbi:MAG: efflux RND transporter periplasmic adaptor subunit [Planctomycetia bacterium]|nr:efflux RND transporter periplasmic adaptor subunit [Planctomycetia bacterium]